MPPIQVEDYQNFLPSLEDYPLLHNIQSIPVHSNEGDEFSMLYAGYDRAVCPIIGEIQDYNRGNVKDEKTLFDGYNEKLVKSISDALKLTTDITGDITLQK